MNLTAKRIIGALGRAGLAYALLAVGLACALAPATPVYAEEYLPEWAQDPNDHEATLLQAQDDLPSQFDLRDRGVVTSVKLQDPWAVCWSFACIAAAETSIISDLGAPNDLDLSEKHLAWYGMHPVKEVDAGDQAGEGITVFKESEEGGNAAYIPSNRIVVSTLFSTGVGPVYEGDADDTIGFPYRGSAGITELDALTKDEHREAAKAAHKKELIELYGSEEYLLLVMKKLTKYQNLDDYLDAEVENLAKNLSVNSYSGIDDWSIPDTDESGESNRNVFAGYTLRHGNLLPNIKADDGELNQQGMQAVKQELMDGHGVAISLCADTSMPNQESKSDYINLTNWAHYTYKYMNSNHAVCIVGWDDNYPAANFAHEIKGVDSEEAAKLTTPPGNGAWIAKNSWGCSDGCGTAVNDESQVLGKNDWGVDGSGFFYISYYDQSISMPQSFEFDDDFEGGEFISHVYDYMPSTAGFYKLSSKNVLSSANIFTANEDEQVVSVSTRSTEPNSRVTFALYELNDDAKDPTDGKLIETQSYDIDWEGFHRFDLTEPFKIRKGQKFSIVSTVSHMEGGVRKYDVSASEATGKQIAELRGYPFYGTAVVHEGESAVYKDGKWIDWLYYQKNDKEYLDDIYGDVVDNFSIKAYALTWDERAYECVDGDGATWAQGSSQGLDFTFEETVKKDQPEFDYATVDDVDIDPTASVIDSTNMVTNLSAEYLSSLKAGTHTLTVYFEGGESATATFTIKSLFTIRWLDGDGSVLQEKSYVEGEPSPAYDGKEPTKAATARETYSFVGWDTGEVDGSVTTYRPRFDASPAADGGSITPASGGKSLIPATGDKAARAFIALAIAALGLLLACAARTLQALRNLNR